MERAKLTDPSLATLQKVAGALGVSIDYLLGEAADDDYSREPPLPDALAAFTESAAYRNAVADLGRRWRLDE